MGSHELHPGAYRLSYWLPGSYAPGTDFQRRGPEVGFEEMNGDVPEADY